MELPMGTRLKSTVDTTEVVVVKAPTSSVDVRCGGKPMVLLTQAVGATPDEIDPRFEKGTLVGKRYVHDEGGVELLCTKAGTGSLSLGNEPLEIKAAKPLPSSD